MRDCPDPQKKKKCLCKLCLDGVFVGPQNGLKPRRWIRWRRSWRSTARMWSTRTGNEVWGEMLLWMVAKSISHLRRTAMMSPPGYINRQFFPIVSTSIHCMAGLWRPLDTDGFSIKPAGKVFFASGKAAQLCHNIGLPEHGKPPNWVMSLWFSFKTMQKGVLLRTAKTQQAGTCSTSVREAKYPIFSVSI